MDVLNEYSDNIVENLVISFELKITPTFFEKKSPSFDGLCDKKVTKITY